MNENETLFITMKKEEEQKTFKWARPNELRQVISLTSVTVITAVQIVFPYANIVP